MGVRACAWIPLTTQWLSECVCVCVCVCLCVRERERESVCVCVHDVAALQRARKDPCSKFRIALGSCTLRHWPPTVTPQQHLNSHAGPYVSVRPSLPPSFPSSLPPFSHPSLPAQVVERVLSSSTIGAANSSTRGRPLQTTHLPQYHQLQATHVPRSHERCHQLQIAHLARCDEHA